MISKKILFVLTLIAIDVIAKASASGAKTKQLAKKQGPEKTSVPILSDTTSSVEAVPVEGESTVMTVSSEERPASLVNKRFEELIKQRKYRGIEKLGKSMNYEKFLEQLCLLIVSPAHYKGLCGCLKRRKKVPYFFVYGRMEVVKEVIAGIEGYDTRNYIKDGDLEVAVPLALKEDHHDRAIDLFVARQERTAEKDEQCKQKGETTSFGVFMYRFFVDLAPWKDNKSLKRFMTLKGEAFNNKHPTVYETFSQELVCRLGLKLDDPNGKKLMVGLVAQPVLLALTAFVKGFLWNAGDTNRSNFITYSWREAVQEGLKKEYPSGGEKLWKVIMDKYPGEFLSDYPPSDDVLDAVLKKFPTKQDREKAWIKENAPIFVKNLEGIITLPTVLWSIVFGYSPLTWIQV